MSMYMLASSVCAYMYSFGCIYTFWWVGFKEHVCVMDLMDDFKNRGLKGPKEMSIYVCVCRICIGCGLLSLAWLQCLNLMGWILIIMCMRLRC